MNRRSFLRTIAAAACWLALWVHAPAQQCAFSIDRYIIPAFSGGSVAKLRENSGNTTADFKLNASNALVRTSDSLALASWLSGAGATDAFVHTLYDQTGTGNNATQTTTANQPKVVVAGMNSHASLYFDGTNDYLDFASDFLTANSMTGRVSGQMENMDRSGQIVSTSTSPHLKLGQSATGSGIWFSKIGSGADVEIFNQVSPFPFVMSARHGSNTSVTRWNCQQMASQSDSSSTAYPNLMLGANNGASAFHMGYLGEFQAWTSSISDGTRLTEELSMMGVCGARQMTVTDIDTGLGTGDGTHDVDIDGNGLRDLLFAQENGIVYWYEQTTPGSFTRHTIVGSSVGGKVEGCLWIEIDGFYHALVVDQTNDNVRVISPNTPGDYEGSWTSGTIVTSRPNLQRAYNETLGGTDVVLCTYEGDAGAGDGGVIALEYDGSGAVNSSGNWTVRTPFPAHPGTWALIMPMKDLNGDGRLDLLCGARNTTNAHNADNDPGMYWLEQPSSTPLTTSWTAHDLDTTNVDYQNGTWGDFFGNGVQTDFAVHIGSTTNSIRLYNSAGGFGSTISPTTVSDVGSNTTIYNVIDLGYQRNSRDAFMVQADSVMRIMQWTGTEWRQAMRLGGGVIAKADNYVALFDVDGDGDTDWLAADSLGFTVSHVDFSIPADGALISPSITSNGAGSTASIDVTAGDTAITTVTADGSAPLAFVEFGDDSSLVSINASSGVLVFDAPSVVGTYTVTVSVSNAGGDDSQDLTINVEAASNGNFLLLLGSSERAKWQPVDIRWQDSDFIGALAP